jgi:hypothetical protein
MDSVWTPSTSTATWTPAFAGVTITAPLPHCKAKLPHLANAG